MTGRELKAWRHRRPTPKRTWRGRKPEGWSIREACDWMGVTPPTWVRWESSDAVPRYVELIAELSRAR